MIAALDSGYVRTAVLKGLPGWAVALKHALPNALLPTISEIGMNFGYVLGGIVIVSAVDHRDIPVVGGGVLVVAVAYGIGNLLADVTSILLNPRLHG